MGFGQIQIFLSAVAEPHTEQPARADGIQALQKLIAGIGGVFFWMQPKFHTLLGVGGKQHDAAHNRCADRGKTAENFCRGAADEDYDGSDEEQNQRGGDVPLNYGDEHNTADHDIGDHDAVTEGVHAVAVRGNIKGKQHHKRKLHDFARLNADWPYDDPAFCTVAYGADKRDKAKQDGGNDKKRNGELLINAVVKLHGENHHRKAEHRPNGLPDHKIIGVIVFIASIGKACAEHHDRSKAHQNEHKD